MGGRRAAGRELCDASSQLASVARAGSVHVAGGPGEAQKGALSEATHGGELQAGPDKAQDPHSLGRWLLRIRHWAYGMRKTRSALDSRGGRGWEKPAHARDVAPGNVKVPGKTRQKTGSGCVSPGAFQPMEAQRRPYCEGEMPPLKGGRGKSRCVPGGAGLLGSSKARWNRVGDGGAGGGEARGDQTRRVSRPSSGSGLP